VNTIPGTFIQSHWRRCISFAVAIALFACATLPGITHAADTTGNSPSQPKGLQITPVRQFLSADAGAAVSDKFTVTNMTSGPLDITFSIQQFSVANYTYDYMFSQPDNGWLHLLLTETTLEADQSRDVPYILTIPADSKPGGHYYTLFASADLTAQGLNGTVQATDLLYVTVNGELTSTSHLEGSSVQRLSLGREIPFRLEALNTGNTHQFVYVSGHLRGLTAKPDATSGAHLLLPGKTRTITGNIPSPILPGIYRAVYGYRAESGQIVTASQLVVFIPPWFIALLLGILLLAGRFLSRRNRKAPPAQTQRPVQD